MVGVLLPERSAQAKEEVGVESYVLLVQPVEQEEDYLARGVCLLT